MCALRLQCAYIRQAEEEGEREGRVQGHRRRRAHAGRARPLGGLRRAGVLGPQAPRRDHREGKLGKRAAVVLPCELFPEAAAEHRQRAGRGRHPRGPQPGQRLHPQEIPGRLLRRVERPEPHPGIWTASGGTRWCGISSNATGSLGWSSVEGRDQGLLWAMARAWHNWCRDFCDTDPTRPLHGGGHAQPARRRGPRRRDAAGHRGAERSDVIMPKPPRTGPGRPRPTTPSSGWRRRWTSPSPSTACAPPTPTWAPGISRATWSPASRSPWSTPSPSPSRTCSPWGTSSTWGSWSASQRCEPPSWRATQAGSPGGSHA